MVDLSSEGLTRELKKLERQLEKTHQKHNEIVAKNRQLKDEIDALRRERKIFEEIYVQLDDELVDKAKNLSDLKDEAAKAGKEKENIEHQLANLRQQANREENEIEKEFKSIFEQLYQQNVKDRVQEKFGNTKTSKLKTGENFGFGEEKKDFDKKQDGDKHFDPGVSKTNLRDRSPLGLGHHRSRSNHHDKKKDNEPDLKSAMEKVEEYDQVFQQLKEKTEKNNLNEILDLFAQYENQNYRLYKHLNHLNDEREGLEKQIEHIKDELKELSLNKNKDDEDNRQKNNYGT